MGKIFTIANEKGGVGKTTTVLNLAYYYSNVKQQKTLLLDLDPQHNLTDKFFYSEESKPISISRKVGESNSISLFDEDFYGKPYVVNNRLHILGTTAFISAENNCPSDEIANFAENLNKLSEQYDLVFIDCPPSVGNLQFSALTSCAGVLIPTEAEADSIKGVDKIIKSVSKIKKTFNPEIMILGILLNKTLKRATQVQDHFTKMLREQHGCLVFNSEIQRTTKVAEASHFNQSILEYDLKSAEHIQLLSFLNEFDKKIGVLNEK
ncbi:ParA family protein [Candidatus Enterovibrio escicola]|uniref:Chromosome (Plasmid) partitioning protein ParA n=2 Tax=Candidatus Enterovibrio escicola TaxID=1927127 RepID=A0A2A5T700_9GAMM|nr:ParA family protein [Candidatus Enterovibrio escacola]PCS23955.1 Chromosome (plasmid) partitioning protein ParA [Candidatus Enterovibrio escacola]